jgi:flagellar protein FlaG
MRIEGIQATAVAQQPNPVDAQAQRDRTQTAEVASQAQAVAHEGTAGKAVGEHLLDSAVSQVSKMLDTFSDEMNFTIRKDADETVIKVVNRDTGEVIRQIPSQQVVDMAANFQKQLSGLIVDHHS